MIQGTGSGVGKSTIVTGLCRIFKDMGFRVAPFKAQNIALNSAITLEGGEIGRAQALQAMAAGTEPVVDMNPVLIKPSGRNSAQVIVQGTAYTDVRTGNYHTLKKTLAMAITDSFDRLRRQYDLIILEGAGSAAEINLMNDELVNMFMARYAHAPVLLAGDIDNGGVFASFYGTVKLLGRDSRYIKGLIVNKFRGDTAMLRPALDMIGQKIGRPVVGVIPYIPSIGLPEEDGLILAAKRQPETGTGCKRTDRITIVVIKLGYISNFTDFDPFLGEPDVDLVFSDNPSVIRQADLVIVPGSKNTMDDLLFLKNTGIDRAIQNAYAKGTQIIGICGGYQMLGKKLLNPYSVEGSIRRAQGIGLLPIETTFLRQKTTFQVVAELVPGNKTLNIKGMKGLKAFEIHTGKSTGGTGLFRVNRLLGDGADGVKVAQTLTDGSVHRNCWGTYLHGIFDNDLFRRQVLNMVRRRKGLKPLNRRTSFAAANQSALDQLAQVLRQHLDMDFIKKVAGI